MSEEAIQMRERLAVAEATLKAHGVLLEEVRDALKGINISLHTLTRLEERTVSGHEQQSQTRRLIVEETQARKRENEISDARIHALEELVSAISEKTGLNSHGRALWEMVALSVFSAAAGSSITLGVAAMITGGGAGA